MPTGNVGVALANLENCEWLTKDDLWGFPVTRKNINGMFANVKNYSCNVIVSHTYNTVHISWIIRLTC